MRKYTLQYWCSIACWSWNPRENDCSGSNYFFPSAPMCRSQSGTKHTHIYMCMYIVYIYYFYFCMEATWSPCTGIKVYTNHERIVSWNWCQFRTGVRYPSSPTSTASMLITRPWPIHLKRVDAISLYKNESGKTTSNHNCTRHLISRIGRNHNLVYNILLYQKLLHFCGNCFWNNDAREICLRWMVRISLFHTILKDKGHCWSVVIDVYCPTAFDQKKIHYGSFSHTTVLTYWGLGY